MPKRRDWRETSKKQKRPRDSSYFLSLPSARPTLDLGTSDIAAITPLPWRIPVKGGERAAQNSLRKRGHRLLNLPSYAFPPSDCHTL